MIPDQQIFSLTSKITQNTILLSRRFFPPFCPNSDWIQPLMQH